MNPYETLGLTSYTASADEIKRAYFRLVRLHSPDKDPETFKRIRAAYELLTCPLPEDKDPSFPDFSLPPFQMLQLQQVHFFWLWDDTDVALSAMRKLLDELHGDEPYAFTLQRYYVYMAFENNKYVIAIREGNILLGRAPDDPFLLPIVAQAYFWRKWYKKALSLFQKGYMLGLRGHEFEIRFAQCLDAMKKYDEVIIILLAYLQRKRIWNKNHVWHLGFAFRLLDTSFVNVPGDHSEEVKMAIDLVLKIISVMTKTVTRTMKKEILTSVSPLLSLIQDPSERDAYAKKLKVPRTVRKK